jgi:hypothetical protein
MQLAKCSQCGVVSLPGLDECQRCGAPVLTITPNAFVPHAPARVRVTVTEASYEPVAPPAPPPVLIPTPPAQTWTPAPTVLDATPAEFTPTIIETPLVVEEIFYNPPPEPAQDWQNTPEMAFFTSAAPVVETPAPENAWPATDFTPSDWAGENPPEESFVSNGEYHETPPAGAYQAPPPAGQPSYAAPQNGLPPARDPNYYAARAAEREAAQAEEMRQKRQHFLAQAQYAAQQRPFTQYNYRPAQSGNANKGGSGGFVAKIIMFPLLAVVLALGAWKVVVPRFMAKEDDPNLPKAGRLWFSSWLRSEPTAAEIIRKHAQVSGEDKFPQGPKTLYMSGTVEMLTPQPEGPQRYRSNPFPPHIAPPPQLLPSPAASGSAKFIEWKSAGDTFGVGTFEAATTDGKASFIFGLQAKGKIFHHQSAFDGRRAWETQVVYSNLNGYGWQIESDKTEDLPESEKSRLRKMSLGSVADYDPQQKAEYMGKASVNGFLVYEVLVTKGNGQQETRFYDAQTGLMACMQSQQTDKKGEAVTMTMFFDDYREVNGVKMPFSLKQKMSSASLSIYMIMKAQDYKFDETINKQLFEPMVARSPAPAESSRSLIDPLGRALAETETKAAPNEKKGAAKITVRPPVETPVGRPQEEAPPRRQAPRETAKPAPAPRKTSNNTLFGDLVPASRN